MGAIDWAEEGDWCLRPALEVRCPVCGDPYQHHAGVGIFERRGEDGPTAVMVYGAVLMDEQNPSPRRDAVRVAFEGECGHAWVLDIIQHKGNTFLVAGDGR